LYSHWKRSVFTNSLRGGSRVIRPEIATWGLLAAAKVKIGHGGVESRRGKVLNGEMAFSLRATESGTLEFTWVDDDGSVYSKKSQIKVG
jgi:hypothetical protein